MSECRLFLMCHFWKAFLFIMCLFFHGMGNAGGSCKPSSELMSSLQDVACATPDLRTAIQKNDLLRKISSTNFFSSVSPMDVVRSVETLSFFNRSLTDKIQETHKSYQESGVDNYTLSITSYPSDVKKGSCSEHKTIDFNSDTSSADFPNYSAVPGKEPRSFQVGTYKGRSVICERTRTPYKQRVMAFCGRPVVECRDTGRSEDCSEKMEYEKCKRSVPISCLSTTVDDKNEGRCISLESFSDLSQNLLLSNVSLERRYCPDGCSYYTQTVQRVYRNSGAENYCSDNYLIVHCGPEKDANSYNLNIREINNLCSYFDLPSCS